MLKSFRLTALVVFTAFVFVSLAATTAHAQKPALTKSIDEPGRSPYFSSSSQYSPTDGEYLMSFKPVPAGFRLVITYVSVFYTPATNSGHLDNLVALRQSSNFADFVCMPAPSSIGTSSVTSAPITFYVEPGSTLYITVHNSSHGNSIFGTITGYLVALD
jgi:hypothetical protein